MADETSPKTRPKKARDRQRRDRGTGSIFFHVGRQVYVGRKVVGHGKGGKPLYRKVSHAKRTEVVKRLEKIKAPGDDTTVREWATTWLASLSIRQSTRTNYVEMLDTHILPEIGEVAVSAVKASRVETLVAGLRGKGLAPGTVKKIVANARSLFAAAIRDELITKNPVPSAKRVKGVKKKIDPVSRADLKRVITESPDTSSGRLVAFLAGVGARIGEATALDVPDWDAAAGTVAITKTFTRRFGLGPPKSVHSTRTIRVPAIVRPILVRAIGDRTTGPLFASGAESRVAHEVATKTFRRLLKRLGLARRNVHQLRHSVATALISVGTPIGDVAKYLGDTAETIVTTYLHPTGVDPSDDLDKMFSEPSRREP